MRNKYNKFNNILTFVFIFFLSVLYCIFGTGCSNKKQLNALTTGICPLVDETNFKLINNEEISNLKLPNDIVSKYNIVFTPNVKVESKLGDIPCPRFKLKNEEIELKEFTLVESIENNEGIDGEPIKHSITATVFKKIKIYDKLILDDVIETKKIVTFELEPLEIYLDENNNIINTRDPNVKEKYEKIQEDYDNVKHKLETIKVNNIEYIDGDIINIDGFLYLLKVNGGNYNIYYFNKNIKSSTGIAGMAIENKFNNNKYIPIGNVYLDEFKLPIKKQLEIKDIPNYEEW